MPTCESWQSNSLLLLKHAYKAQQGMATAVLLSGVLLVFFNPHLKEDLCAKICNLCFSVPTWWLAFLPRFPSRVTIMVLLIITWTLVPTKTERSHEAISYGFSLHVTVQFLVSNCASEMSKHSGCEKLLQNKKASKGWEWLLYGYI